MDFDNVNEVITPTKTTSLTIGGTGALFIPAGTAAERPVSPQSGYIRFNTDNTTLEYYNGVAIQWETFGNTSINAIANISGTGILTQTSPGVYAARSIAGTTNRVTLTNGDGVAGNPTVDIAATYVGQTSITTLGTVGTGTWQGTAVGATFGGTGQTVYAVGDILAAATTTTLSKVADVATGNALISGGVGVLPSWGKIGLATHVSGTLGVANGGTGLTTTPTNGQLLIGNGTGYTLAGITAGTAVSVTNGAGSITIANTGATSIAGTANQITASAATGAITLSTPAAFIAPGSVQVTTTLLQTQSAAITAAGATQGTATSAPSRYNIVTTVASSTGVILPLPVTPFGNEIYIANRGANPLNIYPNTGAAIVNGAANAPVVLPVGQEATFVCTSVTQWWTTESILAAGANVTLTASAGILTIAAPNGAPAAPTTSVQWNNAGAFGGSSAFLFTTGTNPFVTVQGTSATNQIRVGPAFTAPGLAVQYAAGGTSTVYIETDGTNQDGQLVYFNNGGTAAVSGYIGYAYDTQAPYIRIVDADDDAPYITFNTIGTGTITNPLYVSTFGARGTNASRTLGNNSGFSWYVGANTSAAALITANAPIMELDTQFLRVPTGTTGTRPGTPINGMVRYNSTLGRLDVYENAAWVNYITAVSGTAGNITATPTAGAVTLNLATAGTAGTYATVTTDSFGRVTSGAATQTVATGGTGLTTLGTANQILGVNTGATGLEYKTLTAGANITITPAAGSITIAAAGGGSGSPGGTTGQIQYNNAGAFGGATNVNIDNGDLLLDLNASPVTPPTDTIKLFNEQVGGRNMLAMAGPAGLDTPLQPNFGRNKVTMWNPAGNSTTITAFGAGTLSSTGTATTSTVATTNIYTYQKKVEYLVTTASTTAVAGWRYATAQWTVGGTAAGLGGFHHICRWGPATGVAVTTNRCFVGMASSTAAPTDVEPSTITNMCGVGWDSADTNLQFMYRGAGAVTKVDLGASFPVPTTDRTTTYEIAMFSPPGTTQTLGYQVTILGTGGATTSGTVSTNLPSTSTLLAPRGWMSVGGTSNVIGIALVSLIY